MRTSNIQPAAPGGQSNAEYRGGESWMDGMDGVSAFGHVGEVFVEGCARGPEPSAAGIIGERNWRYEAKWWR